MDFIFIRRDDRLSGAWLGFRAVNPYHSLINQLGELNENQRHHLTDEIRRTVGSSTAESLLRYVSRTITARRVKRSNHC